MEVSEGEERKRCMILLPLTIDIKDIKSRHSRNYLVSIQPFEVIGFEAGWVSIAFMILD